MIDNVALIRLLYSYYVDTVLIAQEWPISMRGLTQTCLKLIAELSITNGLEFSVSSCFLQRFDFQLISVLTLFL